MRYIAKFLMAALLAVSAPAFAASYSGTLNAPAAAGTTSSVTWIGTVTGIIGSTGGTGLFNPPCTSTICDIYTLTVNVPATFYSANTNYAVHVSTKATPNAPNTDIDVYVYDANSNVVSPGNYS